MDSFHATHRFAKSLSFGFYTTEEIKKMSVKLITVPSLMDDLGLPIKGGLYDPALGPIDKRANCTTCSLAYFYCPGHFGHIELPMPAYNPLTFDVLYSLFRNICTGCHRYRLPEVKIKAFLCKLRLSDYGLIKEAEEIDMIITRMATQISEDEKKCTAAEICEALDLFTQDCLGNVKNEDCGKISLLSSYRRKLLDEFLKTIPSARCPHCKRYVQKLHKHANAKIFAINLTKKLQNNQDRSISIEDETVDEVEENEEEQKELTEDEIKSNKNMKFLSPMDVHKHLELFWKKESFLCDSIYGSKSKGGKRSKSSYKMFFVEMIPVTPTKFRPPSVMNDQMFENPQNSYLTNILKLNQRILELNKIEDKNVKLEQVVNLWLQLQDQINCFYDSTKTTQKGKALPPGIKQILEKKEGLFRKHMMGKRVNFAARSVISPDPNIETSEIGIPMVFAKKLSYPEPVTSYNFKKLRQAVINGPLNHPGATHIQHEDGSLSSLENFSIEGRIALANQLMTPNSEQNTNHAPKKVLRHLETGDILLLNRQPTLHKPSMMGHKARILSGEKTIRMHYANCNTYNADFDGDEMNVHFHQSELARAEGYFIANTDNQYLAPTDGSPLRGLIQDHVVTGVMITMKDTFLNREQFQQLIFGSIPESSHRILLDPPCLLRPTPMWSGKQVITCVLKNLLRHQAPFNLISTAKIPARMWGCYTEESTVLFNSTELLTGVLDKAQFGATSYGLVHCFYELYGPQLAGQLLSTLGRLFNKYLLMVGFTCRMDDLLLLDSAECSRKDFIAEGSDHGKQVISEYVKVPMELMEGKKGHSAIEKVIRNDEALRGLDSAMKGKMNELTSKIIDACLPAGQYIPFPYNNMSLMTVSGAKGSNVNLSQISGLLGQQELEGRRVPIMTSGKSLPSFKKFDTSARSGGYITNRFLTGIKPQEFFFHCMAGREGLIDTAVKTSRSGYLQRCLVKHLEGLKVNYDQTVRESDGSVLQFHYGEDSLDVTRQKYLFKFDFSARNYSPLVAKYNPIEALEKLETESALKPSRKAMKNPAKYDPVLSKLNPGHYLGSISEKYAHALEEYISKNTDGLLITKKHKEGGVVSEKQFRALMWLRYMNSLVNPGEAVGVLAAQSVGEPSTQMTLNTFHFAGFGAKNVTLGIPRLREIIMTAAKNIKTPMMSIPFIEQSKNSLVHTELCQRISKMTLQDVLTAVQVSEHLSAKDKDSQGRFRVYKVHLTLVDSEKLKELRINSDDLKECMETKFFRILLSAINKYLKKSTKKTKDDLLVSTAAVDDYALEKKMSSIAAKAAMGDDDMEAVVEDSDSSAEENVESEEEKEEENELPVVEEEQEEKKDENEGKKQEKEKKDEKEKKFKNIKNFVFKESSCSFEISV